MKNDKITIYTMPLSQKIFSTIVFGCASLFLFWAIFASGDKLEWYATLYLIIFDMIFAYVIFTSWFARIVFDGEKSVLKLCDFRVRTIPLQNIKVVKRDEDIYSARYGVHCRINIELISGEEKRIGLSVPRGAKQKSWLEHIDQEIADLNKRIDNWYMEYRKQNKKR